MVSVKKRGVSRATTSALAIMIAVGLGAPVFAQVATPDAEDRTDDIVVTGSYTTRAELGSATGLPLTIKETPQSITVMTAQRMEDQSIRTLSDALNNAAGVSVKNYDSSRNGFSARGFAIENYQIDGIPVQWDPSTSAGESELDIAFYDRLEIVRGATGLTTGVGDPSASINLIRKRATSDVLKADIAATAGRWSNYSITGDVQSPLTANGKVRARVVAKYEEGDSYVDLLHNKKFALYGVIDADLTETTALNVGATYQDNSPRGTQWGGLPIWYADGTRTDWPRSKTVGSKWTSWASTNETYFANITQQIGDRWTVKLYGNYVRNIGDLHLNYLFGAPDRVTGLGMGAFPTRIDNELRQIDVGVKVDGSYKLFGRDHELIFGTSYARQKLDTYAYPALTFGAVGNYNLWDGSFAEPAWGPRAQSVFQRTKQWGYFAATRINVADPLKVILGARLASWKRKGVSYGTPSDFGDTNRLLPYAGAMFDVAPNHTLYVSYTKIFKPQNAQDRNANFLPPINGVNYEAGLKSSFFNGALNTAISVFKIKQNNLAQSDPTGALIPGSTPPTVASIAAKGAQSKGFEIEANGEILPGWSVSTNYTQFKAKDANGNRINTLFPQKLLRFFSTYDFEDGALSGLTLGGGVNWEGLSYTDSFNPLGTPERVKVEPFAVVNAMTRYTINDAISLQLNVDNLLDKKYYSQIGFFNQLAWAEPRNFTFTLRYKY